MPRLPHLVVSLLTTVIFSQGWALNALAADPNTYRPGQAYLKAAANSHEVCEQQCQGDAQCRGWNFVRPQPRTATGICEFNARAAMPVSSAISISGEITTSIDPLMSRAIPAGTRTRRVGTPATKARKPVNPAQQQTRVNRMPIPAPQLSLNPTGYTSPGVALAEPGQSNVYGRIDKQRKIGSPTQHQMLTPQQQHYRQQFLAERQRAEQFLTQQHAAMRQKKIQRPQVARPIVSAPQPIVPRFDAQAQQAVPSFQQPSLYGTLHDDLTKGLTPVPRPQTAPDNLNNPDAPVATSRATPVKDVEAAPLKSPVIPDLAGAEE